MTDMRRSAAVLLLRAALALLPVRENFAYDLRGLIREHRRA
jgi:hypothetical protein